MLSELGWRCGVVYTAREYFAVASVFQIGIYVRISLLPGISDHDVPIQFRIFVLWFGWTCFFCVLQACLWVLDMCCGLSDFRLWVPYEQKLVWTLRIVLMYYSE